METAVLSNNLVYPLIGITSIIINMFLGNLLYLMIKVLPHRSSSTLNRQLLPNTNTEMKWFKHHNNKEYYSFLSRVPIIGYREHKNKSVLKFEIFNTIFNTVFLFIITKLDFGVFAGHVSPLFKNLSSSTGELLTIILIFLSTIVWSVVLTMWTAALIIDFRHYIIPDFVNLSLFISALILFILGSITYGAPLWNNLIIGAGIFLFFFILGLVSGGMGGGDVKFIISSGIIFGPQILALIFIASLLGAFYRAILVPLFKIGKSKESPEDIKGKKVFPFGPFLVLSSYIVLLFSPYFVILLTKYFQTI